ncbi:MAG: sigma-70 family RNA polymerase sigma factor [Bacteroidetes bacterium]|nr:sigma-70 family RNA polymerase sigma factor [Bacteroidota bacterium]
MADKVHRIITPPGVITLSCYRLKPNMTPAEFQETVLIHKNKLFRFAKRMLEDEEDARDVVQDTFLKLWAKRKDLESVSNMEAFSMRTVKNLCIDRMRSLGYRNNLTSLDVAERSEKPGKAADALEMKDLKKFIQQIISQLPEQQKMVIQMRDIEGYEYKGDLRPHQKVF